MTLLLCILVSILPARAEEFRFNLLMEPLSLDPQMSAASGGNYLFHNIYRGLYRVTTRRGLIKEGAKSCVRHENTMRCKLNPVMRWSNGHPIEAGDYVVAFRRLATPEKKSPQSELIFSLKNARAIWAGKMPPESLGVKAVDHQTLLFTFAEEDPEFEFKLASPALSPWPPTGILERKSSPEMPTSGPYIIAEWKPGHYAKLKPSTGYGLPASAARPDLSAAFVDSDATALRLYESGKMDFLRRLTAEEIPRFRGRPDFHQIPVARFDYVGFGPELEAHGGLREALTLAVDFPSFKKLFDTDTAPGCPSLPLRLLDREVCLKSNPERAKKLFQSDSLPELKMEFSRLGGDDIQRAAEWFQAQWKRTLDVDVRLSSVEQTVYLRRLHVNPPAIFRKGVNLDRPTCLAALELFSKNSPENFIHFANPIYDEKLRQLRLGVPPAKAKRLCREAINELLTSHRLIPLGRMYFTVLASPRFRGWDLNELNQLDLTDLEPAKGE